MMDQSQKILLGHDPVTVVLHVRLAIKRLISLYLPCIDFLSYLPYLFTYLRGRQKYIKITGKKVTMTDRYMQVSTVLLVLLPEPSASHHILFIFLPCDHWFGGTKYLADQDCCLTFGNLSHRRQCVDEAWWLRCTTH